MTNYATIRYQPAAATTTTVADMTALIAVTGMSNGDQALVLSSNNLFMYSGTGWYKIATIQNDSPTAITGVNGTYVLATDGTPTVITAVSTDPEGFPLTWSYSTSGLGSIATVSQVDNVFTITPSTDDTNFGTFTLTINATDGVNGAVSANTSITLQFYIANSSYTTLLATAVDTSDNNNITDSSTNNHAITVTGDATAGTFSPYRHGGYSAYYDGIDGRLHIPNQELEITTEDFTIEAWINYKVDGSGICIASNAIWITGDNRGWRLLINISGNIVLSASQGVWNNFPVIYTSTNTISDNEWNHISICRESGVISSYINGIKDPTTLSYSSSLNQLGDNDGTPNAAYSYVGAYIADNTIYGVGTGYIADFHFKLGSAKYNSNFTPPTERLTAEAGTTILLFNDNTIKDNSTNSFTVEPLGGISLPPRGPFDNLQYSTAVHGGSVYFDGSGDRLSIENIGLNGDLTLEGWFYQSVATGATYRCLLSPSTYAASTPLRIYTYNSSVYVYLQSTGGVFISGGSIIANTWFHVALVRSSGTWNLYVDGVSVATSGTNGTYDFDSTVDWTVGSDSANTYPFTGYASDVRFINGTAVYTSNFTPPTAPLAVITNTSLLLSGTNASVIDKSQNTNLKLVGNTTGSTTQVKFADTKSIYFDGTGDYIASNVLALGSDDFTIEAWIYFNTDPTVGMGLYQLANGVLSSSVLGPSAGMANSGNWAIYVGTSVVYATTGAAVASTWYHVAHVRNSGTAKLYVNGAELISTADTNIYTGTDLVIGGWYNSSNLLNGYISDFRVTKGLARYTANFTPPAAPLKG